MIKILPISAFVLGLVLVGITSGFTSGKQTSYTFEYVPPSSNDYSQAEVENLANWEYTTSTVNCGGSNRACSITAPASLVNTSGDEPELKSEINLETKEASNEAYIISVETGATFANQN